ncbi:cupin domain-containing protein [Ostreiculturibacter nitratireducens]|uniref:cupin domain-containing protein n=1 Tax=Ostreiculturibacter nitratireducens TaxID=3075226 RepID=UPI0031B61627
MPKVASAGFVEEPDPVHPVLGGGTGPYSFRLLSDPGGLTQFGAFIEELPPGSRSGRRHWHETEDEMIYVLSGEVVLVEDAETVLRAGDAAAWPAGSPVGHRLDNRSDRPARYLVIGARNERDTIHYPDHDLITHKDGTARRYLRSDGTEHARRRTK